MRRLIKEKVKLFSPTLIFIILLSLIFRFYNLREYFPFGMDQEYEIFLVKNILNFSHIPLIGVNASDTGLYLGPLFIYFSVIPYLFLHGNPLGFAVFASSVGILTTYVIFKVAKDMFNSRTAYFSSFLYGVSFLAAYYDRHYWNPMPVPLVSLLIGYFLFKIDNRKPKYFIYLAAVFGLTLHIHLSLLIFTPLIIWILYRNRNQISKKILIASITVFLLIEFPLILFDLRHNFTNTKALFNFFSTAQDHQASNSSINQRANIFINYIGRFIWVPPAPDLFAEKGLCTDMRVVKKNAYPEMIGLAFICLIFFIFFHRKLKKMNKSAASRIIISVFILSLLAVFLYNRNFPEYYFGFMTPYLAILLGVSFSLFWEKEHGEIPVFLFLIAFLTMNFITLFTAQNSYSLNDQKKVIEFAKKYTGGEPYSLEALGDCPRFTGWRYLFEYYNKAPASSYMDSYFGWLFKQNQNRHSQKIVLLSMIDDTTKQDQVEFWHEQKIAYLTKYKIIDQETFDKIQVYILTPKSD